MVAVITIYEWHPSVRVRRHTLQWKIEKGSSGNKVEEHEVISNILKQLHTVALYYETGRFFNGNKLVYNNLKHPSEP